MLTTAREILTKIETTEGIPAYSGGSPTALETSDGILAIDPTFTPEIEYEDPDIASGTLDTSPADVGLETGSISFGTYFRGASTTPLTTAPPFDAAVRACGMTREAMRYAELTTLGAGGTFLHGEQLAVGIGAALTPTVATNASACVITVGAHGLPAAANVPIVLKGVTMPTLHDYDNTLSGGWNAVYASSTTLTITGLDTTSGGTAVFASAECYVPPIVTSGNITVTPTVSPTTIRLATATVEDWSGPIGGSIDLEIRGEATATALNGRHTATVSAISAGIYVEFTVAVDTSGGTSGTHTIMGIPTATVCGEKAGSITDAVYDNHLFVYNELGEAPADAVVGGFGSKATATITTGSGMTAGGYRYRPIGERTFTLVTTAVWSASYIPSVGDVIYRRNECGAYGRCVTVSADGKTITYEPYGDSFAAADGIKVVQGDGLGATAIVSSVVSAGGPSLTFEGRFGGVIYTYVGARGTFTAEYEVGKPIKLNFEFNGLKYKAPFDSVLAGVVIDETGKVRFLQGFSKTRDLSGLKVCDYSYEIQQASVALNRSPTQKPDASSASGVKSYRHQEQYVPEVTMDPSMTPVGAHAWDAIAAAGSTVAQLFGAGSSEGNRVLAYCPAVQYGASSFGDRDGERTVDFTGQCRKSAGNDAVQLFIY